MKKHLAIATILIASGITGGYAFAGTNSGAADQAEMQAALGAKVAMTDAIQSAESASGGKATEAVFTGENGKPGYEVTTVTNDGAEHNLFVDATTGKAVAATPAAENENDENGAADDFEEGEQSE